MSTLKSKKVEKNTISRETQSDEATEEKNTEKREMKRDKFMFEHLVSRANGNRLFHFLLRISTFSFYCVHNFSCVVNDANERKKKKPSSTKLPLKDVSLSSVALFNSHNRKNSQIFPSNLFLLLASIFGKTAALLFSRAKRAIKDFLIVLLPLKSNICTTKENILRRPTAKKKWSKLLPNILPLKLS